MTERGQFFEPMSSPLTLRLAGGVRVAARQHPRSRRVGDKRALADVFRAITSGALRPAAALPTSGIGRFVFRESEVRRYFGTPLLEAGMSLHELTNMTGWKHESVSYGIEEGYLEAETIMLRGQTCRVVMPAQLLNFFRKYVPLTHMAKLLGTRLSALARRLEGVEVIGAKPLGDGGRRGGLVRLADLARTCSNRAQAPRST
jgi:hypothetical protein